jgi:acetyl-CoA C-acetyltransferase
VTVHVSSTGLTRFGKRPESLVELLAEAGERALEGLGRKGVDRVVVGSMAAGSLGGTENLTARLADRLGLESAGGFRVEAASASGAAAFQAGWALVAAREAERVLVLAGEKMTDLPTAEVAAVLARSLAPSEERAGATMPALAALVTQLYLARYRRSTAALDAVSVVARTASALNEYAQFRSTVSAEEVGASRPIALPLRLLHCSAVSDGAAAVVLEKGPGAAGVLGVGQGFETLSVADRPDPTSFKATRVAAQRAYEMARLTRREVQFAEVHDAFAPFALIDLEDLGVCGAGEAGDWYTKGEVLPNGRFPVNVSGGLLGRGHPVGASGLVQVAEVARQLRGEAGRTQLDRRPTVGVAQSIGGLASHNFVTILGQRSPA